METLQTCTWKYQEHPRMSPVTIFIVSQVAQVAPFPVPPQENRCSCCVQENTGPKGKPLFLWLDSVVSLGSRT